MKFPEYPNLLAFCFLETGENSSAYKAYVGSLELNPTNESSLRGACFLAIELAGASEAVQYCERFHETSPAGREQTLWFAIALWNSGDVRLKKKAWQLIDANPDLELRLEFEREITT